MTQTLPTQPPRTPPGRRPPADPGHPPAHRGLVGLAVRIVLLAVVDALAVYGLLALAAQHKWGMFGALLVGTVAVNVIYAGKRHVPAKYLAPGVALLLVYQVYVVFYTGFAAFTNYGDGHNSDKPDAVAAILAHSETRVPDSPVRPATVVARGDRVGLLVTLPDRGVRLGWAGHPLEPVADPVYDSVGRAVAAPGWHRLSYAQIASRQKEISELRVPASEDPNSGSLRTADGISAAAYRSTLDYDRGADTITDRSTGKVYRPTSDGVFAAADGTRLSPGWKVLVGLDNFEKILTDRDIRGPFLGVLVWTFVFAGISVAVPFAIGLVLAAVLDGKRLRGHRIYRSLIMLPYAFPAFLAALVWQGLLNTDYGYVNVSLLDGAHIPWLTDPWLARLSVLAVNVWISFPYMFLICTGALQAIPAEVTEAARIDGARRGQILRHIKLPLLLTAVTPMLIATFAFNFNNFNVIYMLTGGGPKDPDAPIEVGSTDLLISLVYKLAFGGSNRQYGMACAVSILIFVVVAAISVVGLRRSRAFEES
ncbi:ABC transporter permease subunit [Embleya hyalina]|uniref:Maltose/maltodextrin transport system permease protein n=1 Tax=Embleya hyalina TaxID=516124 RepID=A0A401YQ73_9ACTN|nr:ABC transporter permease subunit [Embleya hyalina]GCD96732.1 sugar ABC transporter permease [Embleya hyalina]